MLAAHEQEDGPMRITIVGAGYSGTALATQLAASVPDGVEICLVGEHASFGKGIAYGLARPEHFLNVRANDLGLDPDRPNDFADWLDLADSARHGFLPRAVYGDYLADRLDAAVERAPASLSLMQEKVITIQRRHRGFRVFLADGSDFQTDLAVIAVGALPPRALPAVEPSLAVHPRYIGRPWSPEALEAVAPDARVLIVGTGLTMADVVISLRRQGHVGPITAISRHGLVPLPHKAVRHAPITPPALLKALEQGSVRDLLQTLRAMARVGDDWRTLIDGLRPHVQAFWKKLGQSERARFLRHVKPYWEAHRHRIAPEVAQELASELERGGLTVEAAHLLNARLGREEVQTLVRPRGSEHAQARNFDVVVRATGFETDITKSNHALVAHLREAELLGPDPLGLGVRATDRGEVIDGQGDIVPGLYVLGPLQRGQLWEITAIPELRNAARWLAERLLLEVRAERPVLVSGFEPLPRVRRDVASRV